MPNIGVDLWHVCHLQAEDPKPVMFSYCREWYIAVFQRRENVPILSLRTLGYSLAINGLIDR